MNGSKAKVFIYDNPEMAKLCNINHDNLNACKNANREYLPTLRDFFEEAIEQLDPVNQIEKQYHLVNRTEWSWKALRLLAKRSAHYFMQNQNAKTISEYLEAICQKLGKEMQILTNIIPPANPSVTTSSNISNILASNINTANSEMENEPINGDEPDEDIEDSQLSRVTVPLSGEQQNVKNQTEEPKAVTNEERLTKLKQEFQMDEFQEDSQSSTSSVLLSTPPPKSAPINSNHSTDKQQDDLVNESIMNIISDQITSVDEWKQISEKLLMDEDTIAFIESELSNSVKEQCKKILLLWKVRSSF